MEADAVRRQLHPEGVVSYLVDGTVDVAEMAAETASFDTIYTRIGTIVEAGGTGIRLAGTSSSQFTMERLEGLLAAIKDRFTSLWVQGFSAGEILALANRAGISVADTIQRLQTAGLDSIPGTPDVEGWADVHRTAHRLGMKTSAAMIFGAGETMEQRVAQLEAIRQLQAETGGFTSFVPYTFQPSGAQRAGGLEEATAVEYLKTLAIARMYLDNIENVQASVETQGLKVVQMGLRFGGNDVGSALSGAAGYTSGATEEELRRIIRDAGFKPAQRDPLYRMMFLN